MSLSGLFAKAGITVRDTTYATLPATVLATYATGVDISSLDACAPLSQLFRNGTSGQSLNVFFVSSFKGADVVTGKVVVGLDGSIPGPATTGGSTGSGVAVSTVDLRFNTGTNFCGGALNLNCGADLTAYFIAHEAGHYLGLSHTSELYGYRFDAVSDTSRCPCSACKATSEVCATSDATVTNTSHTMTVAECTRTTTCGGGDNLMFWTLSSAGSKGSLSTEQARIMLANPLVQ